LFDLGIKEIHTRQARIPYAERSCTARRTHALHTPCAAAKHVLALPHHADAATTMRQPTARERFQRQQQPDMAHGMTLFLFSFI